MRFEHQTRRMVPLALGLMLAMATTAGRAAPAPSTVPAATAEKPVVQKGGTSLSLSKGRGQLVTLPIAVSDVMISNPAVADVQVRSPRQIYIFGKASGESTVFAITSAGKVAYSANVRVAANVDSVGDMIRLAMPDANITATAMNGLLLLTGTVATPEEGAEAERLAKALVGTDVEVVNRTKTATPVQVNLQVRIAEVNRQLVRTLGVNLMSRDTTGGFLFGIAQGRNFGSIGNQDLSRLPTADASSLFGLPANSVTLPFDPATGSFVRKPGTLYDLSKLAQGSGKTSIGLAGHFLGLDLASAIDLAENEGLATTLAQPNLTAVSGETASFLAGGEIPVPMSTELGQVSVEFKQYGVSLSFTPTVLSDGRISMRVRPEVSQLTTAGAVQLNGFAIPALSTRRVETTVELGSGQSFMIGGLLLNSQNNAVDKAPGIGNLPVIGALFRSNEFRKNETELVVVVTPYLVRPVSTSQIKLPTDGMQAPTELGKLLTGDTYAGVSGAQTPKPVMADPVTIKAAETKLIQAGIRSKDWAVAVILGRAVLPLLFGTIAFVLIYWLNHWPDMAPLRRFMWTAGALIAGYKGPDVFVQNMITKRLDVIRQGLPDALDLLVICAEAGLTVDAAFARVARELGRAYPELADELGLTSVELGFLTDRRTAFQNLAMRIPLDSVKGVATTMIQTEKYGTPLASALRVLSAEFRNERMMRAEAKAARLPAIMTVPLILFILPALFIIILGPAACSIMDSI